MSPWAVLLLDNAPSYPSLSTLVSANGQINCYFYHQSYQLGSAYGSRYAWELEARFSLWIMVCLRTWSSVQPMDHGVPENLKLGSAYGSHGVLENLKLGSAYGSWCAWELEAWFSLWITRCAWELEAWFSLWITRCAWELEAWFSLWIMVCLRTWSSVQTMDHGVLENFKHRHKKHLLGNLLLGNLFREPATGELV